jgi:hypothetical protein
MIYVIYSLLAIMKRQKLSILKSVFDSTEIEWCTSCVMKLFSDQFESLFSPPLATKTLNTQYGRIRMTIFLFVLLSDIYCCCLFRIICRCFDDILQFVYFVSQTIYDDLFWFLLFHFEIFFT